MIIVDSSVLIAIAIPDDAQHKKAVKALSALMEPVGIPNAVLVESGRTLWGITKDARFIENWCRTILSEFQILCEQPELVTNALGRYAASASRFSLVDCELIEWNKTAGFEVLSFDGDITQELSEA